ncbi:MAG TPA: type II toxin-antitoxin system VapC family toxin [Candidatus Sulfotelmatobacter sp.]|nr:type II toxin-antitoxin system VapC family toxin [Candidatus Sulfotelmatobacter sp.]
MTRFVLDASVVLSWFIDRPTAPYATKVKQLLLGGSSAVVPSVWRLEVANGFLTAERRGVLSPIDTSELLQNLDIVLRSIEVSYEAASVRQAIDSARSARLTAYDAAYLALAREEKLPIATLDRGLVEAAGRFSVALLQ